MQRHPKLEVKMFKLMFTLVLLSMASTAMAQTEIPRAVLACGGATTTSATHTMRSTLGQFVVGWAYGTDIGIVNGYWAGQGVPAAVDDEEALLPTRFALRRATPNPFGSKTAIRFDVPTENSHVDLIVFDVSGRQIRTLYSGPAVPGHHEMHWDGRSDSGLPMGSGAYFLVFSAPGYHQRSKLILLK
jgi:hypothetical protein